MAVVAMACGSATPAAVTGLDSGRADEANVTPSIASLELGGPATPVAAPSPASTPIATSRAVPSPTVLLLQTATPALETAAPILKSPATPPPDDMPPAGNVTPNPSPEPLEIPSPAPPPVLTPTAPPATEAAPTQTAVVPVPTAVPMPVPTPIPTTTAPTPTPTTQPAPSPTAALPPINVGIVCIFFDGIVPTSEADEYVEIRNFGDAATNIGGWSLTDIADGAPTYRFSSFTLSPGDSIRVYTNEVHPESGGFSFGRGGGIWNNNDPDEAGLFDTSGNIISRSSYPPGC